ncbi:MAG: nucleotidyltransferase family protein, partial [Sphingomonadaceae bacterium]
SIRLSAVESRRFAQDNNLPADLAGAPVVRRTAEAARAAGLPLLVVLGHDADAVRAALVSIEASFVTAPDWAEGMGRSLAAGAAAAPPAWAGALILLGDMPLVPPASLRALADALAGPEAVAAPVHGGRRGNPVALGRAWLDRLPALSGDRGARDLLAGATVAELAAGPEVLLDCDTPEALAAVRLAFARQCG